MVLEIRMIWCMRDLVRLRRITKEMITKKFGVVLGEGKMREGRLRIKQR